MKDGTGEWQEKELREGDRAWHRESRGLDEILGGCAKLLLGIERGRGKAT